MKIYIPLDVNLLGQRAGHDLQQERARMSKNGRENGVRTSEKWTYETMRERERGYVRTSENGRTKQCENARENESKRAQEQAKTGARTGVRMGTRTGVILACENEREWAYERVRERVRG